MKITILEENEDRIKFVLEGTNPSFANALRRTARDLPTLAIEDVDIEENTSGLYDELIAHRLGLLPLKFPKTYNLKSECKCGGKGCSLCEVVLVLEKQGPCIVKSGDMKSTDKEVGPLDKEIPIVELLEGQKLKFEATAVLGRSSDHAKWQSANVGYKYKPSVKIKDSKEAADAVDVCPRNVFEKTPGGAKVANEDACILCLKCVEHGVSVTGNKTEIIFTIESVCGSTPKEILISAFENMEKDASAFISELRSLK